MTNTAKSTVQSSVAEDHVPGQPYELTREGFVRFAGLEDLYRSLLAALKDDAEKRYQVVDQPEQSAFWGAISIFEARRLFDDGQICSSGLQMDSLDHSGRMRWSYRSTSGTEFCAVEYRDRSQGELSPPRFTVTIPADRDQPGRWHHDQLRAGGTYCDS